MYFAEPWWVNLLILVPIVSYGWWWTDGLAIANRTLVVTAFFGAAFGFVEASVVVYLRAATGQLPGYGGSLADVAKLSSAMFQHAYLLGELPSSLLNIEIIREAATIIMLMSVALLAVSAARERWAIFLWAFAIWDIIYYVGLWATVGWPSSLLTPDVLFLIPVPWFSQVWFPILVSLLTLGAIIATKKKPTRHTPCSTSTTLGSSELPRAAPPTVPPLPPGANLSGAFELSRHICRG